MPSSRRRRSGRLQPYEGYVPGDIQCLCCGTTSPDLLFPGHALMVQGELGIPACEAVTTSGICLSGITAFKYACMSVAAGLASNAVATGSELASSYMRAQFLTPFYDGAADLETRPVRAFDADFLRWMLSDGAGAVFLSTRQTERRAFPEGGMGRCRSLTPAFWRRACTAAG